MVKFSEDNVELQPIKKIAPAADQNSQEVEMKLTEQKPGNEYLDELKIAVNVYIDARSKRCYRAKNGTEKLVVNKLKKWLEAER